MDKYTVIYRTETFSARRIYRVYIAIGIGWTEREQNMNTAGWLNTKSNAVCIYYKWVCVCVRFAALFYGLNEFLNPVWIEPEPPLLKWKEEEKKRYTRTHRWAQWLLSHIHSVFDLNKRGFVNHHHHHGIHIPPHVTARSRDTTCRWHTNTVGRSPIHRRQYAHADVLANRTFLPSVRVCVCVNFLGGSGPAIFSMRPAPVVQFVLNEGNEPVSAPFAIYLRQEFRLHSFFFRSSVVDKNCGF